MDFEQFKEDFSEAIKKNMYEKGEEGANIDFHQVQKTNETYEAMTFTPENSSVGVNVNLNRFFDAYQDGTSLDELADRAADIAIKGIHEAGQMDVTSITDYDKMKDKLVMEVVSAETNADLLTKVPHQEMEDMAVVYRFEMANTGDERASILVTNNLLDQYGITAEQLHADAMENAPEIKPAVIQGMTEVMKEMMGDDAAMFGIPEIDPADEMMFVASTPDRIQGAGVIAYQDFMDQAAEKLGGDFFILPSSIHEILLVKDDGTQTADALRDMVQEVNETQVAPDEKLTDNVYHYDSQEHVFELAEKFEARQMNMEETADREDSKDSLLDDLKAKKEEVAKQPKKEAVEKAVEKNKGGEAI